MTRGSVLLACALACGIVLRLIWPADMEWKADEQRMFSWATAIGVTEPWPSLGMASGVALPNPGLSVWLFVPLAHTAGIRWRWRKPSRSSTLSPCSDSCSSA
jgi:hypothetical protein